MDLNPNAQARSGRPSQVKDLGCRGVCREELRKRKGLRTETMTEIAGALNP